MCKSVWLPHDSDIRLHQENGGLSIRKKIINISSGSGIYPAPTMSVYCSVKAGINMFTQSVGSEQRNRPNPVEIIAVNPGMVDTDMQRMARGKNEQEFEMAKAFAHAHESAPSI